MSLTPVDVYDAASAIGLECQSIISEHGPGVLLNLMPKVISMLEELEACALYREREEEEIIRLREVVDALRVDCRMQTELKEKLHKSLEQLERSWYSDTQQLLQQITELEAENNSLAQQLAAEVCPAPAHPKDIPSIRTVVMESAAGRTIDLSQVATKKEKPTRELTEMLEEDISASVILETEERVQLNERESVAADLQLIGRLKECISNNFKAIHGLNRELMYTNLSIDAAEEEVCRLARQSGQLPSQVPTLEELSSELATLEQQLISKEREVSRLQERLKFTQEVSSEPNKGKPKDCMASTQERPSGTGINSGLNQPLSSGFQGNLTVGSTTTFNQESGIDEIGTMEELRQLIWERNDLRYRLVELKEQMVLAEEEGSRSPEVQGPLPREPLDKVRPGWAEKPTIESIFRKLMARLTEDSTE